MARAAAARAAQDILHVSNTGLGNNVNFELDTITPNQLHTRAQIFPVTVPAAGKASVWFWYKPTTTARTATWGSWTAPAELDSAGGEHGPVVRYDSLIGNAITPTLTFTQSDTVTLQCADTSIHSVTLSFVLSNSGTQDEVLSKVILSDPTDLDRKSVV